MHLHTYVHIFQVIIIFLCTLSNSNAKENIRKYREKLCDFLKNSQNYSPEVVLKDFPTNELLVERALILGRLKEHEKVLAIYVQVLGDVQKAAEYCEANYADDKDIFATLLKTLLKPVREPPYENVELHPDFLRPNEDIILELLNKYAEKIDPYVVVPVYILTPIQYFIFWADFDFFLTVIA